MRICGLNKTTLLDYPGRVAAVLFLGGCNFRCPFCQNGDLVVRPESQPSIEKEEVMAFLRKRKGILTGVCITGGEPTIEDGLEELIEEIKDIGYLVKLDTNGYCPEVTERLTARRLVDYIAMDIKNSNVDYEFRTTVVRELHDKEDIFAIGRQIEGAKAYFLQGYQESEGVIFPGFHSYNKKEMERMAEEIRPFVSNVQIRGME